MPFRSEAEAFNFLLLTIAAFAAVAVASLLGGVWVGVPVWGVVTAGAAFVYLRRGRPERRVATAPAHVGPADERQVLVIANESFADDRLVQEIERAGAGYHRHVHVVFPALTSPVHRWTSDLDGARAQAQVRLDESLSRLHAADIEAEGEIGDEDPLLAIENALRSFGADEIIISTRSADVVKRARERFALPITHVVIDSDMGVPGSRKVAGASRGGSS